MDNGNNPKDYDKRLKKKKRRKKKKDERPGFFFFLVDTLTTILGLGIIALVIVEIAMMID